MRLHESMEDKPDYMTVEQAANLLGRSQYNVRAMLTDGRLQGAKIGGRWYVSLRAIQQRIDGE
tara:strand:- start:416 stop:604 length:189 start_codon:yes stop_codon:yes gene_type:complete